MLLSLDRFEFNLQTYFRLLRNVLSQYGFRFLDVHCQQNLSAKFDLIQANLVVGERRFLFSHPLSFDGISRVE